MIAQTGLNQLIGPLLSPFIILWMVAAFVLLTLVSLGAMVLLLRAWNRRRDR